MLEIRPYREEDYSSVQRNLQEAEMFDEVCDSPENLFALGFENPEAVLVADLDGEVVGSVVTVPFGIHVALIFRLVVAEAHRRKGIGSQLLETVEHRAKYKGFKELWLYSDVEDDKLTDYYEKRGFQYNKDHKYYGPWKNLS